MSPEIQWVCEVSTMTSSGALEHKGRHVFKCFLLCLYPAQGPTHLPLQCGFDECVNEEETRVPRTEGG